MKKNKIFIIIGVVLIVVAGVLAFIFLKPDEEEKVQVDNVDALKFKSEYESLNNTETSAGQKYRTVNIPEDNPIVYATADEIVKMMDNEDSFAVYFGFKSCPWCRSVISTLIEVAKDLNIKKIYYVDVLNIRDTYELNDKGKAERTKEGSEGYYKLLEKFDSVLSDYNLTNSKGKTVKTGEKRIYAPNVISVVHGVPNKLTEGTSSKQTDAYMEITDEMKKETFDNFKCVLKCLEEESACTTAC